MFILAQIRQARPELRDRRLRLILSGQLLTDGTHLLSHFAPIEERQEKGADDASPDRPQNTAWLHCSVGPSLEPGEEEDDARTQVLLLRFQGYITVLKPHSRIRQLK